MSPGSTTQTFSNNEYTVAGLFSGCGGLDIGFKKAGFKVVWANEWDADAAISYESLMGHSPIVEDIWNVLDEIPDVDIIIGGPPCQSFSLIGKRLEEDSRGKLVHAFSEAIRRKMPKAFVMENVPGLVSSSIDGVRLPAHLITGFEKLGYQAKLYKVMATDYFVPQRRNRILIIGVLKGYPPDYLVNGSEFAKIIQLSDQDLPVTARDALDDLPIAGPKNSTKLIKYTKNPRSGYAKLMRINADEFVSLQNMPTMSVLDQEFVKHIPPGGNYMDVPDEFSTKRIMNFKKTGGRTTTYGRLDPNKPSYTINTYFNRPNVGANYHYKYARLITVREALRLQSFPDEFTPFYKSQRSLHMQIGNAVPPLLARAIAESLKTVI